MQHPTPALSFIVPVYNAQEYLPQCIQSLLGQTRSDIEVVLVDDGSTDNSAMLCDQYAQQDPRIIVSHQANRGVSAARNAGIALAKGDRITFVDADDWVERTLAERVCAAWQAEWDVLLFGYADVCGEQQTPFVAEHSTPLHEADFLALRRNILSYLDQPEFPVSINRLPRAEVWGKVFSRDFVQKNALRFPEGLPIGEDACFNLLAFLAARQGYYLNEVFYYYRVNHTSVMHQFRPGKGDVYHALTLHWQAMMQHDPQASALEYWYQVGVLRNLQFALTKDFACPDNPAPYPERKAAFLKLRDLPLYEDAFHAVPLQGLPITRKVMVFLMRHRLFWGAQLMSAAWGLKQKTL